MTDVEAARQQAARFLAMAANARENGNVGLAELLTEAAARALDKANEAEAAEATTPPPKKEDE